MNAPAEVDDAAAREAIMAEEEARAEQEEAEAIAMSLAMAVGDAANQSAAEEEKKDDQPPANNNANPPNSQADSSLLGGMDGLNQAINAIQSEVQQEAPAQ